MYTFLAVIKDLWEFVLKQLGFYVEPAAVQAIPALEISKTSATTQVVKTVSDNLKLPLHAGGVEVYVASPSTCVFCRPVLTFDGVVTRLPYATRVSVIGYEGRFARVAINDTTGFVLKDDLTELRQDIFPEFLSEEVYSNNHPDTKKVRALIKDEFFATALYLPLQGVEFVVYRLLSQGRIILWPSERPRIAGRWQTILKGRSGISIGIMPKTGAIIEYLKPDGSGFVGYTKAVHVDDTIVLQSVGRLIEGEYREEIVTKDIWHEWRPVWISVT